MKTEEKEKIIGLEDYTRCENLKFHNIPESNFEGDTQSGKQVILDILENKLQIDTTDVRFQAFHRIGKGKESRNRPIIVLFAEKTGAVFLAGNKCLKIAEGIVTLMSLQIMRRRYKKKGEN